MNVLSQSEAILPRSRRKQGNLREFSLTLEINQTLNGERRARFSSLRPPDGLAVAVARGRSTLGEVSKVTRSEHKGNPHTPVPRNTWRLLPRGFHLDGQGFHPRAGKSKLPHTQRNSNFGARCSKNPHDESSSRRSSAREETAVTSVGSLTLRRPVFSCCRASRSQRKHADKLLK